MTPQHEWKCCSCDYIPTAAEKEKGLCPRCNPKQEPAYNRPDSRWTLTNYGRFLQKLQEFRDAMDKWLKEVG